MRFFWCLIFLLIIKTVSAQPGTGNSEGNHFFSAELFSDTLKKKSILAASDSINKCRVAIVSATWATTYGGALIGLNALWYKNYPRSSFHFFNDIGEWNQIDKVGHTYTAYFESQWSTKAFLWSGMQKKKAYILGAVTGFSLQTTLEILDGFSAEWGFSVGDISANTIGSAINMTQNFLWNEQRIRMKFSSFPEQYPAELKQRASDLYGSSFPEKVIKDYNGQTYWLSENPSMFMKRETKFPKWLNVAVGYGADGMYGGYENIAYDSNDILVFNRTDIPRARQFYLSPDISFSRIKTNSHLLKTIFEMVDVIKFPAPSLEYNTNRQVKFHWIYF